LLYLIGENCGLALVNCLLKPVKGSVYFFEALITSTIIGGIAPEEGSIIGTAIVVTLLFLLAKPPGISMLIQDITLAHVCGVLLLPSL
jgi:hypothetical protein